MPWFAALRGQFVKPVEAERSPASLLAMFGGNIRDRCRRLHETLGFMERGETSSSAARPASASLTVDGLASTPEPLLSVWSATVTRRVRGVVCRGSATLVTAQPERCLVQSSREVTPAHSGRTMREVQDVLDALALDATVFLDRLRPACPGR